MIAIFRSWAFAMPSRPASRILKQITSAEDTAAEQLLPLVYDELKRLAAAYMSRERDDHTLQPTALVHEAYFKLVDPASTGFTSRAHFLGVAGRAMRQVLVDHARKKKVAKRGGGRLRVTLEDATDPRANSLDDILALHEALERLADKEQRLARVVELRYFGGLTIPETGTVLGLSHTTIEADWALAKAWLNRELATERP